MRSEKRETEKLKILHTISNLLIWHMGQKGAEKGGKIDGRLAKEGQKINLIDFMIAGIAVANEEKILTRNIKHFSQIIGLRLETY